jgi:hypothetical protein
MTKKKDFCRCGKEIHHGTSDCKISKWDYENPTYLCSNCFEGFKEYIQHQKYMKSCLRQEEMMKKRIERKAKRKISKIEGQTTLFTF